MARIKISAANKRRVILRLLLVAFVALCIVAGLVCGLILLLRPRTPVLKMTALPFSANNPYCFTQTGFLYVADGSVHYMDSKDESKSYSRKTAAQDFRLAGRNQTAIVYNDYMFQFVNTEFPVEFTGKIISIKCGASHVAVLREDASGSEALQIFNLSATPVDQLTFEGQYILDYGFYDVSSTEYLWIMATDTRASIPVTTITTYDMQNARTTGMIQIQDQLVDCLETTSNSLFVVGTNQLIRYAHQGNRESYRSMTYGWRMLDFAANKTPTLLMAPRSGYESMSTVKIATYTETDVLSQNEVYMQMPPETLEAFLVSGKLVALTGTSMKCYDLSGKLTQEYDLEYGIDRAQKLDNNTLLLQAGNALYTVKVP